ncbi:ATP-binding cassette domain-containing protein [Aquincola agrisoli]|uniref:hypothetical protein n=1 Tax=Aquincola TaxID=391952 RepID=UPI00361B96FB
MSAVPSAVRLDPLASLNNKTLTLASRGADPQRLLLLTFSRRAAQEMVYDNVAFPLREHTALPDAMVRDLVLMKLHAVGLRGAAGLRIAQLSGGMARRVAWPAPLPWTPTDPV